MLCCAGHQMPPPSPAWQQGTSLAQRGELGLFSSFLLPAPLPRSSGCSPSLPEPGPAAGSAGAWGARACGALPGDCCGSSVMGEENLPSLAVNKVNAALGCFFPKGCQQAPLLINLLSKWSLLFCLQNV